MSVSARLALGEPVVFCAESDGVRVQVFGEPAQPAASVPIDTADVVRVLKKSGPAMGAGTGRHLGRGGRFCAHVGAQ